jgi:hypothetical protein
MDCQCGCRGCAGACQCGELDTNAVDSTNPLVQERLASIEKMLFKLTAVASSDGSDRSIDRGKRRIRRPRAT